MKLRATLTATAVASAVAGGALTTPASAHDQDEDNVSYAVLDGPRSSDLHSENQIAHVSSGAVEREYGSDIAPPAFAVETDDAIVPAPAIVAPTSGSAVNVPSPTIRGTGDADVLITVTIDGQDVGTTTTSPNGEWSLTDIEPLADGAHTVAAIARNSTGQTSAPSHGVQFVVDTVAPSRPSVISPTAGETIAIPRPLFTGTGEPGSTMMISIDGSAVGRTTVHPDGRWAHAAEFDLRNGSRQLSFRAQDDAGNLSLARNVSVTVEVTALAPVITSPVNESVVTDIRPVIRGTTDMDCSLTIRVDGVDVGTVAAAPDQDWTFALTEPLLPGPHTAEAVCENASGGVSDPSTPVTFTVEPHSVEPPASGNPGPRPGEKPNPTPSESRRADLATVSGEERVRNPRGGGALAETGSDDAGGVLLTAGFVAAAGAVLAVVARRRGGTRAGSVSAPTRRP